MSVSEAFYSELAKLNAPRVIEIGTCAWSGQPPRHHRNAVLSANPSSHWLGVDAQAGEGVDVVADAHELRKTFAASEFNAFICVATLEHFRRPWIAVQELAHVVKPGGIGLVATHQSFPVHGYPNDYFRFSREALGELFAVDHGWKVVESAYEFPCKIVPLTNDVHATNWNFLAEAWLNVAALVRRI